MAPNDESFQRMPSKPEGSATLPFGKNLAALMKKRGLTLKQVAELAGGLQISVVQNWIEGKSPHDLLAVRAMAKGLGVPFSEIVFGEREIPRDFDVSELFDESDLFEGLCRVAIKKLTPKKRESR